PINRSEVILNARVIGGLQMVDDKEADDKIIAVLDNDTYWDDVHDINELPKIIVERIRHYFTTYKVMPGEPSTVCIDTIYGVEHAIKVVQAAIEDYNEAYGQ
ncbi:MAG TPA: inorganic pyrophosphatase, partial [Candidatus Marinimicrobia bacterium]|nr:inorganic pyrophosphatase [Candidatus Neomarinimicrobiota bacterium]